MRIGSLLLRRITTTTTTTRQLQQQRYSFHASTAKHGKKWTVTDLASRVDLNQQNVLVRVDLNAPLDKVNQVSDDTRLQAIVPTTQFLLEQGAHVLLMSHFGRPKGQIMETGKNGRLRQVAGSLEELLDTELLVLDDCVGPNVEAAVANRGSGGTVTLLENTRFHVGETQNDPQFAAALGRLADFFVMDAFGTAHRAHASTVGVVNHMQYAAAGFLLQKELDYLQTAVIESPTRPLTAIVGGAKVSTKLPVLSSLLEKCDKVLVGGGMMFTFYKALGYDTGKSLVEDDLVPQARELMETAKRLGKELILPTDVVVADTYDNAANTAVAKMTELSGEWMGLDIGPDTVNDFTQHVMDSKTVVWNGPMGVFEMSNFATGTLALASALAKATENGAVTIVGGGDSVAAMNASGLADQVSHISTGGGASLELLEGKALPGVEALTDA